LLIGWLGGSISDRNEGADCLVGGGTNAASASRSPGSSRLASVNALEKV